MSEQGYPVGYSLVVATPDPLSIDVARLRDRLNVPSVRADLEPYGLHTTAGFLDGFLCGEDALRSWVGEGPTNSDDLPYAQYETAYSGGPRMGLPNLVEPMEDIWPCLRNTGSEQEAKRLHEELSLRAKANRLAFLGRFDEAYAVLPEDIRYAHLRRLYQGGPDYVRALTKIYWNNTKALEYLVSLATYAPDNTEAKTKRIYERILELSPNDVTALSELGAIFLASGELKLAETDLQRAIQLNPRSAAPRNNLGLLFEKTGRHAEALQQWRYAASALDNAMAMDRLAVCLLREGQSEEAFFWLNRAVEINPTFTDARIHLATVLYMAGRTQEALSTVRFLLKMDPKDNAALNLLARIQERGQVQ